MKLVQMLIVLSLTFLCAPWAAHDAMANNEVAIPSFGEKPVFGYGYVCGESDCKDENGKSLLTNFSPITGKIIKMAGSCVLTDSGKIACDKSSAAPPSDLEPSIDLISEGAHCALSTSEKIRCWGSGDDRALSKKLSSALSGSVRIYGIPYSEREMSELQAKFNEIQRYVDFGDGQPGDAEFVDEAKTELANTFTTYNGIYGGYVCGITSDGSIKCASTETNGKSAPLPFTLPVKPPSQIRALDIALSYKFGCAVTSSHQVQCWGKLPALSVDSYSFERYTDLLPDQLAKLNDVSYVTVSSQTICVTSNSKIQCFGPEGKNHVDIGEYHTNYPPSIDKMAIKMGPADSASIVLGLENDSTRPNAEGCLLLKSGGLSCWSDWKAQYPFDLASSQLPPLTGQVPMTSCPVINGSFHDAPGYWKSEVRTISPGSYTFHEQYWTTTYKIDPHDVTYTYVADGKTRRMEIKANRSDNKIFLNYCRSGALVTREYNMGYYREFITETVHSLDESGNVLSESSKSFNISDLSLDPLICSQMPCILEKRDVPPVPVPAGYYSVGTDPATVVKNGNENYTFGIPKNPVHPTDVVMVRTTPDGQLDPNFGSGGSVYLTFGSVGSVTLPIHENDSQFPKWPLVATVNGNDLLVAGQMENGRFGNLFLARVHSDGTFDPSFGENKGWTTQMVSDNPVVTSPEHIVIKSDGTIEVQGQATYRSNSDFYPFDVEFDENGKFLGAVK